MQEGDEAPTYYLNRRRQAMLLQDGKAVAEISLDAAKALAEELGFDPPFKS